MSSYNKEERFLLKITLTKEDINLITNILKTQTLKQNTGIKIGSYDLIQYIHQRIPIPQEFYYMNGDSYLGNIVDSSGYANYTYLLFDTQINKAAKETKKRAKLVSRGFKKYIQFLIHKQIKTQIIELKDPNMISLLSNIHFYNIDNNNLIKLTPAKSNTLCCNKCGKIIEKGEINISVYNEEKNLCIFCIEEIYVKIKPEIEKFNKEDLETIKSYKLSKKLIL
jgi:hypothetical protein